MSPLAGTARVQRLRRRGFALEGVTLGWNVAGTAILLATALAARSVALDGALGWWWTDPVAAYVLVVYAAAEARAVLA